MPPHPALYLRRRVYEQAGCFRTDFGSAADYEFMVRIMQLADLRLAYVPEVLVCMKVGGISNRSLQARWLAHRMDCKAWTQNELSPGFLTLLLKPLRRLLPSSGADIRTSSFPTGPTPHPETKTSLSAPRHQRVFSPSPECNRSSQCSLANPHSFTDRATMRSRN